MQIEPRLSLSDIAFMFYDKTDEILSASSTLSFDDIYSRCVLTRKRINTVCAGLLEVHDKYDDSSKEECSDLYPDNCTSINQKDNMQPIEALYHDSYYTTVKFIHRTARDFLRENATGKGFLEANTCLKLHPEILYVRALLAKLLIFPPDEKTRHPSPTLELMAFLPQKDSAGSSRNLWRHIENEIRGIMTAARGAESVTKRAHIALTEDIDRVVTLVDQQYEFYGPGFHWCTRWNLMRGIEMPTLSADEIHHTESSEPVCFPNGTFSCDFPSFAASKGLHRYVLEVLNTRYQSDDRGAMTRLLWFSTRARQVWRAASLELISELLRRGADPNVKNMGSGDRNTPWTAFLSAMRYEFVDGVGVRLEGMFQIRRKLVENSLI